MSQKENLKDTLISDLNNLHVRADVSIERMVDELINILKMLTEITMLEFM